MASRHLSRMIALQSLYEWDFWEQKKDIDEIITRNINNYGSDLTDKEFLKKLVKGVVNYVKDIDAIIVKSAPERPLHQINIIDRNILRIGLFEVLFEKSPDVPVKVAINEAVELAKNYGGDKAYSFVNGVLGTVLRTVESIKDEIKETEPETLTKTIQDQDNIVNKSSEVN